MNLYIKTWKRAALLLAALLLSTPALAALTSHPAGGSAPAEQTFGKWKLDKRNGLIRFQTSGIKVYGHQFGFIFKPGHCKEPIGWLAWSSTRARPAALQRIRTAKLLITVKRKHFTADVPISSILPITSSLTAFAMTNFGFNDRLLNQIQRARTIKVRVSGPPALLKLLDTREDTFSAMGFTKARNFAAAMCAFAEKAQ